MFALHRNHVSTNSIYLIVIFFVFFLFELLVCLSEAKDYYIFDNLLALETNIAEFEFYLELNRVMIQVFVIANALVSIFVEFLVSKYIKNIS
ncbi:MAG: hypothetical protein MJ252_06700 [archaeon]|nr:hypothetical protein [archaeon]